VFGRHPCTQVPAKHTRQSTVSRENPHVGWHVLNSTPDSQPRKALLQDALSLHAYTYLIFASMTDIQPDQFLTAVWLRGKEYPAANAHLAQMLPPEARSPLADAHRAESR